MRVRAAFVPLLSRTSRKPWELLSALRRCGREHYIPSPIPTRSGKLQAGVILGTEDSSQHECPKCRTDFAQEGHVPLIAS